jgi:hypothetical protein
MLLDRYMHAGLESNASMRFHAVAECMLASLSLCAAVPLDLGSLHKFVCSSSAAQKGLIMTGCCRMCMSMFRGS